MATSWVSVQTDSDWSLQNLPYGIFSTADNPRPRPGVAIGDLVIDLAALSGSGLLAGHMLGSSSCFQQTTLNEFMGMGQPAWREARSILTRLLSSQEGVLRDSAYLQSSCCIPQSAVTMHLPATIPNYTDFYASREHATAVGAMFRGKANALQPNWLHLPVGYHGRASSVVVSGTDVRRPWGQVWEEESKQAEWVPSAAVDYELELGIFMGGPANQLGHPLRIEAADAAVFGYVLLNDWSARDLQKWEYVPLGPFTSKNWATSISPWVVTAAALEPFRVPAPTQDPAPPAYLRSQAGCNYDLDLRVGVAPAGRAGPDPVTHTNMRTLYWTPAQMAAHHTVSGCPLVPGDLLGTGTISSEGPGGAGCLLEATLNGTKPVALQSAGTHRAWLQDGDRVVLTGHCQGEGYRVGFGECAGTLLPALDLTLA
ncbi:hypothetical protein ACKKBG_A26025 [Auxenochlorella protothecoides x Auxenochlorella symbiontica]